MQDTGSLGLVHWDDPEGWYWEGGGRGFQDGEHVYTRGGCMCMYGKTNKKKIITKKKLSRKNFLNSINTYNGLIITVSDNSHNLPVNF